MGRTIITDDGEEMEIYTDIETWSDNSGAHITGGYEAELDEE